MTLAELPSTIGRSVRFSEPDGSVFTFEVIDEVRRLQSRRSNPDNATPYLLMLQRIRAENGSTEIRAGYYYWVDAAEGGGRWYWARYSLTAPEEDFLALVDEARHRGWFNT